MKYIKIKNSNAWMKIDFNLCQVILDLKKNLNVHEVQSSKIISITLHIKVSTNMCLAMLHLARVPIGSKKLI